MQNSPLSDRTLEQLEDEMISLSQRINASEYEVLVLVLEFDIRQGWKAYLFNNCAEWLNMKCGIAPEPSSRSSSRAKAIPVVSSDCFLTNRTFHVIIPVPNQGMQISFST